MTAAAEPGTGGAVSMTGALDPAVVEHLRGLIRDVPDFPESGVIFRDITPLLADPAGYAAMIDALAAPWLAADGPRVDAVVGVEARGFMLAAPVAYRLGVGFVPVRKAGKLPLETYRATYALEYGAATVEIHRDAIARGHRALVIDDVLATGGTAVAAATLVREAGGDLVGVTVLAELEALGGRGLLAEALPDLNVVALLTY